MRTVARHDRIAQQIDYAALAELRYHLRRFLRSREQAARSAGIEPQQYQLLLQIKGMYGRQRPTVGMLAERLQLRHHSAVELIDRLVERGLLARQTGDSDRREVLVALRPAGEAILRRLSLHALRELETEGPALVATLKRLMTRSRVAKHGAVGRVTASSSPSRPKRRRQHDG